MNKQQKIVIAKVVIVILLTVSAAVIFKNLKAAGLRSEAMRAMTNLSQRIMSYKKTYVFLPPQEYLDSIIRDANVQELLGNLQYRALMAADAKENEILAYTEVKYHTMFSKDNYLVIRLNGSVEWMDKSKLEALLGSQVKPM